ncbi:MAG TPA: hypothetical protein GXX55_01825 [Firmicutes bacterium]|nr:hypothetical protein [Bacillota bacterium]
MAFTVEEFHDLIRLLGQHPEWREELRRLVLAEDLLQLPGLIRELGEQTRLLAEAQRRTEERLDALAEAQQQTEQQLRQLAEAVDGRFRELRAELEDVVSSLGDLKGRELERLYRERAPAYFGRILRGLKVLSLQEIDELLEPALADGTITWDERNDLLLADLVARGRLRRTGQEAYLVVEVSWGVGQDDVERAYRRAAILEKVTGSSLSAVAGKVILVEAAALAHKLGVLQVTDGLMKGLEPVN